MSASRYNFAGTMLSDPYGEWVKHTELEVLQQELKNTKEILESYKEDLRRERMHCDRAFRRLQFLGDAMDTRWPTFRPRKLWKESYDVR